MSSHATGKRTEASKAKARHKCQTPKTCKLFPTVKALEINKNLYILMIIDKVKLIETSLCLPRGESAI